jgi:hypothetical protein
MTAEDFVAHCRRTGMLKGHRLILVDLFCKWGGKLSMRDIQKLMSTINCTHADLVKDLLDWGVIKQIGLTLHREFGSTIPVYELTGKPPKIADIVEYKDVYEDKGIREA